MAEVPQNMKKMLFGMGARWHALSAIVLMSLGMICPIVGIIGDAANRTPGLTPTNWFLLAAVLWLMGLASWLTAYHAAKEG